MAQGSSDWVHWNGGITPLISKAGITPLISDFLLIGSETPVGAGSSTTYNWSDGTPVASDSVNDAVRLFNVGSGFLITLPADTTARTLNLYLGAKNARGQITATLSDGSADAFSAFIDQPVGLETHLVTINYMAASAGQTLTIEYTMDTRYKAGLIRSQINLESAALF